MAVYTGYAQKHATKERGAQDSEEFPIVPRGRPTLETRRRENGNTRRDLPSVRVAREVRQGWHRIMQLSES